MRQDQALLAAIVAAPEDDAVRLVYADWCEENGDPARAEFIRTEIEMWQMHPVRDSAPSDWEQPRYRPLRERAEHLWDENGERWYPGLRRFTEEVTTERGFPYQTSMSARRFVAHGETLFAVAPTIEDVLLDQLGKNAAALAACPALAHVRELTFFETPFRAREAEQFFASPHLGKLRSFEVPFTDTQMGPRGARALARCPSLTALENLDVYNHAILDEGADALFDCSALAPLGRLHLGNNGLTDRTAFALARASRLESLRHLNLGRNHLSDAAVAALCQAENLADLEYLALHENPISDASIRDLNGAVFAGGLEELHLADCRFTDEGLAILLGSDRMPQLTALSLGDNALGTRALEALGNNGGLGELTTFGLPRCGLGPSHALLLGAACLPRLHRLTLSTSGLCAEGLRKLLAGPLLDPVTWLDLDHNALGDEGAEVLASARPLPNLRSLWLYQTGLTDRGARALAQSSTLPNIRFLYLSRNAITQTGEAELVGRFGPEVCSF